MHSGETHCSPRESLSARYGATRIFSPPLQGEGWVGMVFGFRVDPSISSSRRKAGPSALLCSGAFFAKTDSRPCAFPRASLRAGHFLLLAQEKVTKEKGTPGGTPAAALRVRYGRPGSADGTSCAAAESARSLAPTLRALSAALRRPTRGQDQERPLPPSAPSPASGGRDSLIGWALAHRLGSSGSPLGAARTRRKKPEGARAGCACVRCQARDGLSANLRSGLAQSAFGRPRPRGCPSLWLLSLGQARESDSLARDGE